jgi:hypothetical protein
VLKVPVVLRCTALLSAGVLVVHDLRYRLAFGEHADHALEAHGHGYLSAVAPLVGLLVAFAAAHLLWHCARGGGDGASGASLTRLWMIAATALIVCFGGQELLEGALSPGHPAGLEGVFGDGGWIALPLAAAVGLLVAALVRGADAALTASGRAQITLRLQLALDAGSILAARPARRAPRAPLAGVGAGRAPPHCV